MGSSPSQCIRQHMERFFFHFGIGPLVSQDPVSFNRIKNGVRTFFTAFDFPGSYLWNGTQDFYQDIQTEVLAGEKSFFWSFCL